MSLHVVYSIEAGPYHAWQAEVLTYSYRAAGMTAPLTCLVSGTSMDSMTGLVGGGDLGDHVLLCPPGSPHPLTGDVFPMYNRITALSYWLATCPPPGDCIILVLDPDMVVLRPFEEELWANLRREEVLAQGADYLSVGRCFQALRRYRDNPHALPRVGVPLLVHESFLAALLPRWMARTEEMRSDPLCRFQLSWTTEMWSYGLAALDLGLATTTAPLARLSIETLCDRPIVHYPFPWYEPSSSWSFDKKTYRPWSTIPTPPPSYPAALATVIECISAHRVHLLDDR